MSRVRVLLAVLAGLVLAVLFLLFESNLHAQESRVAVLTAEETADAKAAVDGVRAAEQRLYEVRTRIARAHAIELFSYRIRAEEADYVVPQIAFSQDFRAAVPRPASITNEYVPCQKTINGRTLNGGCWTPTTSVPPLVGSIPAAE